MEVIIENKDNKCFWNQTKRRNSPNRLNSTLLEFTVGGWMVCVGRIITWVTWVAVDWVCYRFNILNLSWIQTTYVMGYFSGVMSGTWPLARGIFSTLFIGPPYALELMTIFRLTLLHISAKKNYTHSFRIWESILLLMLLLNIVVMLLLNIPRCGELFLTLACLNDSC